MEEHTQEVLVVEEADAVVYPGAVVVHLQDALVALTAVMTSVRFRPEATLTHANSTLLFGLNGLHVDLLTTLSLTLD